MDARALLQSVAETYAGLKSLRAEAFSISESGDAGSLRRYEQRHIVFYVAPDKVRMEHPGGTGATTVSSGAELHSYHSEVKRYFRAPAPPRDQLPGKFRPEFPVTGGQCFLYDRIAERVSAVEALGEASLPDGTARPVLLVSVTYETPPHAGFGLEISPVRFWIDPKTRLVLRQEGEHTRLKPMTDQRESVKESICFSSMEIDQPIPTAIFEFTPPEGVETISRPGGGGTAVSGVGGMRDPRGMEVRRSHGWDGDAMVEREDWSFKGRKIQIEQRWSLSEDNKELRIEQKIKGPKNEVDHAFKIPVE